MNSIRLHEFWFLLALKIFILTKLITYPYFIFILNSLNIKIHTNYFTYGEFCLLLYHAL
jgi:hypothetical protein